MSRDIVLVGKPGGNGDRHPFWRLIDQVAALAHDPVIAKEIRQAEIELLWQIGGRVGNITRAGRSRSETGRKRSDTPY